MEDYYNHIRHPRVDMTGRAWCGAYIEQTEWAFGSVDHAALASAQDRLRLPCPSCVSEVVQVLRSPYVIEPEHKCYTDITGTIPARGGDKVARMGSFVQMVEINRPVLSSDGSVLMSGNEMLYRDD